MWSKCSSESKNHQLFDHNDKHGVKLSQQRRSHYVANYQEFQKNVSLKLLQESLPRQMTELKLLTSQKVKSKKIISNSTRATKLICSPKKLWRDGYIRYINHCVIVKNLAENPKYTNLVSLDFGSLSHWMSSFTNFDKSLCNIFNQGGEGE